MKPLFILTCIAALIASSSTHARADVRTPDDGMIHSIQDIPLRWTGVIGGLAEKTPAVFAIEHVGRVIAESHQGAYSVTFDTTASVSIGNRVLPVTQINLRQDLREKTIYEMALFINDELVQRMFGGIVFDTKTETFSFLQFPSNGVRQFSFQAPRRH